MLDRNPALAVPDESYFVPLLARLHPKPVDPAAFADDLPRLPALREWRLEPASVHPFLRPGMSSGEAIGAIFQAYAAERGKRRWGDKTPLYMQYLGLLERLFPTASYVHLIRDGRDAALSFLAMPGGIVTRGWGHPRDAEGFARQWATEVRAARRLGDRVGPARYRELRYESLVTRPADELRRLCAFAGLEFDDGMLEYVGQTDSARKPHQRRLQEPPTRGVRDWRTQMNAKERRRFEKVAGDLLAELGYEVELRGSAPVKLAAYRLQTGAWRGVGSVVQRSPLWRRRHATLG